MELAETHAARPDMYGAGTAADEPSVSSALERLGAAGQGVVAKRIELASLNPAHPNYGFDLAEVAFIHRIIWATQ